MTDISEDIQGAVFDVLDDDYDLTALLASHNEFDRSAIYDFMPQPADAGDNSLFPLITMGEDTATDFSTDTASGAAITVTIHIWSRQPGWKEAKQIEGAVYDVLHRAELELDNHEFIGIDFENSEHIRDPDGKTLHIAMDFRALIDEAGYGS